MRLHRRKSGPRLPGEHPGRDYRMPRQITPLELPNSYWFSQRQHQSQRLYVAFCEFASAVLDFAEGAEIIRQSKTSDLRLNWSSTILYYSLVHSSRLLIFIPFGDFPTAHASLSSCFDPEMRDPVVTNWLTGFVESGFSHSHTRFSDRVSFEKLVACWAKYVPETEASEMFSSLGRTLAAAKALRTENNYEALLIAHEYEHRYLTDKFHLLSTAMEAAAHRTLATVAEFWGAALTEPSARGFVSSYIESRVVGPVRFWYSKPIQTLVDQLTLSLRRTAVDFGDVRTVEEDVDWAVFNPKRSLMTDFTRKVAELQNIALSWRRTPSPPPPSCAMTPASPDRMDSDAPRRDTKERKIALGPEERARIRESRKALVENLSKLEPLARLTAIAEDNKHTIDFYPPEFAIASDEVLSALPTSTISLLFTKIGSRRKGIWKELAKRLEKL